jgi:hypothetical protein
MRAYEYPEEWDDYPTENSMSRLLEIRLQLRPWERRNRT